MYKPTIPCSQRISPGAKIVNSRSLDVNNVDIPSAPHFVEMFVVGNAPLFSPRALSFFRQAFFAYVH